MSGKLGAVARAAREAARTKGGEFGEQHKSDPGQLDLEGPSVPTPLRKRDAIAKEMDADLSVFDDDRFRSEVVLVDQGGQVKDDARDLRVKFQRKGGVLRLAGKPREVTLHWKRGHYERGEGWYVNPVATLGDGFDELDDQDRKAFKADMERRFERHHVQDNQHRFFAGRPEWIE